ncbi:MAG: response regulator [Anaerolineales bacterium]|nr:response regulator [Anaerolineales bacterium]
MPKLLIVDDEIATVDMLSTFLQISGHEPVGAYSGDDGLVLAKIEQPNLMILDLMMPDVDGYEVCRRIRSHPDLKELPIIIVSARTDTTAIEKAIDSGANVYLTKPINLAQLTGEIQRLLAPSGS